ncbi:ATP-binding cassette domain-containing protein [Candidatus Woesearchaeota archaeon]|nr:ATP-binding cassette domain-containing protein [Candidatus Woesearchaeota archaeon]
MIKIQEVYYESEGKSILKDISLEIKQGEFLAIVGPNGSGKTTLIKHLNGILSPTKGKVEVDGLDTCERARDIMKKVGIVFQNPDDQIINSIVEEDVAFGLENMKVSTGKIQEKVDGMLSKIGISELAKENVNNLSFGQKQLVALAGILVMEPKHIVFDEPFSWLDPKNKGRIKKIMESLNKAGTTIIMVTNNLTDISSDRVVLLHKGRKAFDGEKSSLTKDILRKAEMDEL